MQEKEKLICGEAYPSMREFIYDKIALIVTSPPYNCGKNYGENNKDNLSWEGYWDFTKAWLSMAYNILIPGGRLVVNIPWWIGKKPRLDAEYEFKKTALATNLLFLDKVIWIKGTEKNVHVSGGYSSNGSGWGTYLSPSGPAIRCASEPILVFAKGTRGRKVISGEGRGLCKRNDITKKEFMEYTVDTWFINGARSKDHPAVFPYEIPYRFIKLYTYPGEIVLDPFCGRGTTPLTALALGRDYVGIDTEFKYIEKARTRAAELSEGLAKHSYNSPRDAITAVLSEGK